MFTELRAVATDGGAARLGRLAVPGRKPVDTPDLLAVTSRGVLPHLTPDVVRRHCHHLGGAYLALEDFLDSSKKRLAPAIYSCPPGDARPLHAFTSLPPDLITVLGARRHPAVLAPMGNGSNYVSIYTSTGFASLPNEAFCHAVRTLRPDIAVPLADLTFAPGSPSARRQLRMVERTERWLEKLFGLLDADEFLKPSNVHVFAPLLPVPPQMQLDYLERLSSGEHFPRLSGLAVYDAHLRAHLAGHASLAALPRLSLDIPSSPHHILRQIRLGLDLFTVPFLNNASDAGIALTFSFPPLDVPAGSLRPLGVDMCSAEHQTSLAALMDGCACYTCARHHRAYVHHLLNAREMLGWNLLQIHNHHVLGQFFAAVRSSLAEVPSSFEKQCGLFSSAYDSEVPQGTGERPRARGYHFKAEAGLPEINKPAWSRFTAEDGSEDAVLAAEAAGLAVTGTEAQGDEIPLIPEAGAGELDKKGFAEIDRIKRGE